MAPCFGLLKFLFIKSVGASRRDAQKGPFAAAVLLGQQNDLAAVVAVMSELTLYGFQNGMPLVADVNQLVQVSGRELPQCFEYAGPARFPGVEHFRPFLQCILKFFFPAAPGLLAVFCQKVGPSRLHIAMQVLDDCRDAVAPRGRNSVELLITDLSYGLFAQAFVIAE